MIRKWKSDKRLFVSKSAHMQNGAVTRWCGGRCGSRQVRESSV